MWIRFQCDNCKTRIEVDASDVGTEVQCPTCQAALVVPRKGLGEGTTVGGFRIERLLGRGGMGEVYLARQLSLDRLVALKILPPAMAADRGTAERFLQEVKLTARLEHPHLVTAFEAGEDAGVLYLAMAYVAGPTLHDLIRERGPLAEGDALLVTRKLAGALAYAWNEHQLLHRDVKPSNVLIDPRGEPRLADLGLAKSLGQTDGRTMSGALLGTPNYMSPEQAAGHGRIDTRADMYSLGATLYTTVTGQVPYAAPTLVETLRKLGAEPLPDPRSFAPGLSEACVGILGLMLAHDARHRPATWEALIAEMDRVLAGLGVSAADVPALHAARRTPAWVRPAVAVAGLLAAAGLGVWAASLWHGSAESGNEADAAPGPAPTGAVAQVRPSPPPPAVTAAPSAVAAATVTNLLPGMPDLPPPGMLNDKAGQLFADARSYAMAHPDDWEGAVARFRKVMEEAPHSPIARRAKDFIENDAVRRGLVDRARDRMRRGVEEALRDGKYDEAVERLEATRENPLRRELDPLRDELIARLKRAKADAAAKRTSEALAVVFDAAGKDLARLDLAGARRRLSEAKAAPDLASAASELDAALALVDEAGKVNAKIAASFAADQGREIDIAFRDGRTDRLSILSVDAKGTINGRRRLPQGSIDRQFTVGELSQAEKLRRIGAAADPVHCLMRGLMAVEAGEKELARAEFVRAGGRLGTALAAALAPR